MQPIYFGPGRRLFGVYHPPQPPGGRTAGVVLCHPIGHEYLRVHRAFRNLAALLARAGFPVLRFDYSGSGDSGGDGADARLADWVIDLSTAIDELKRTAGVSRVSLVGLRLGAAMGAVTAARRRDVSAVALWDPVVSGSAYIQQLIQLNDAWLAGRGGPDTRQENDRLWLLGCPMSEEIRGEIGALDLAALEAKDLPRVIVIASDQRYVDPGWAHGIRTLYGPGAYSVVGPSADWERPEAVHTALFPQQVLRAIAGAINAAEA